MTRPDVDRPAEDSPSDFDREFQREFESLSLELAALDARKRQIDRDRQTRDRLRAELDKASTGSKQPNGKLAELRDRLELLDLNLESSLFSWTGLREPFWFGLRYGGLGFVLGWLLHACTQ